MANIPEVTGRFRSMADKATHPYSIGATVVAMLAVWGLGGKWALGKIDTAEQKADTAVQSVRSIEGKIDILIEMQRIQMAKQGVPLPAAVTHPARVDTVTIQPTRVYYLDTTGRGVVVTPDTIYIPLEDTLR